MPQERVIIMLPGLGATEHLFEHQRRAFTGRFVVPDWIEPGHSESLESYARRMAEKASGMLRPGERCVVGGCSMGGFLAAGMRPYLPCDACLLISSAADPKQLPARIRMWRPFTPFVAGLPVKTMMLQSRAMSRMSIWFVPGYMRDLMNDFGTVSPDVIRWGLRMVPRWTKPMPGDDVPTYQLHGSRDHVIPAKRINATTLVHGGGHILPLSHPGVVTDFIRRYAG